MNTQDRIDLVKSSDEFNKTYSKEDFSINATTKEQYLAFKEYLKQYVEKYKYAPHHIYVAYYMFKHRIDNLHEYLDNEIVHRCWKMLWYGKDPYEYGGGEGCMKYEAIPHFKRKVINIYNNFVENNFEIVNNEIKLK